MSLRVAMFAPTPPAPTGIADYVRDLVPLLPESWRVDLFDETRRGGADPSSGPLAGRAHVFPIEAWDEQEATEPYDLRVHHVGNGPHHARTVAHALEHPGLLVLHDAVLHPSRVQRGLDDYDLSGYRAAAIASRPDSGAAIGQLVAGGLASPLLYWTFPLCEDLVRASRHVVVHGTMLARWLQALNPDRSVGVVAHWRAVPAVDPRAAARWREQLGVAPDAALVGAFGHLGSAHRGELLLRAIEAVGPRPDAHYVFVGRPDPELRAAVETSPAATRITLTDRVGDADFGALLHAVDIGLNLRYPTARASSGPLHQLLQLGVPCIVQDLVHLRDLPDAAVQRVPLAPCADETAALRRAIERWLDDPAARRRAGEAGASWAGRELTPERMADGYARAARQALTGG